MNWLSFLIGALVGWLIGWAIDYLICRRRRMAAEAHLQGELKRASEDSAALQAQVAGMKDTQVQLHGATRQIEALKAQLTGMQTLQTRLADADMELGSLRAQVSGAKDLQVHLDGANREIEALKAQLADMGDLQTRFRGAHAELDALRAQVASMRDAPLALEGASHEIDELKAQLAAAAHVQADLDACEAQSAQQGIEIERLKAELAARAAADAGNLAMGMGALASRAPEASVALPLMAARSSAPDDLTVVEGIGAKINALLNEHGIYTFAQLAGTPTEQLRSILDAGGPRFRMADPRTWPEQALLAQDGRWDALKALQGSLKGGRLV